jgi:DNA sulfur modification protein DndE
MKLIDAKSGCIALSVALGLAAGPVAAEAKKSSMPPEQAALIQAWARSTAVYAATYCSATIGMYNLRDTVAVRPGAKAPPGTMWKFDQIATPAIAAQTGYVTPNVDVIYAFGFYDLGQEPVIVTAPDSDGRYYMIEIVDMWDNAFAYAAGKERGYKGGKYAVVGPDWKGELPSGVTRIDSPTRWVEMQPRIRVKDQADLPGAIKVMDEIKVQGLSQYLGKPAPAAPVYNYEAPKLVPKVASSQLQFVDPLQFWSLCSASMNENPPPESQIKSVLPLFKYLGIELGKPWKRESVNPLILAEMKIAAQQAGAMMNAVGPIVGKPSNGWDVPPVNFGATGADYLTRGINSVLGLTANTTTEAFYPLGTVDVNGAPLDGNKAYTLTFKESNPYIQVIPPGFWSVTMYDGRTKFTVPNPINRYFLGSANANEMKKNADGSVTMYLQATSPGKDKEANWLPSPKGPFYLLLRNYAPQPSAIEALKNPSANPMPPIVPVSAK